jgi:hypothetical protein
MTAEFLTHFQAAIADNPDVETELAQKALAVINGRKGIKRTLILNAFERHARQLSYTQQGVDIEAIDWSKVDWMAILGTVLRILLLFLPLVL